MRNVVHLIVATWSLLSACHADKADVASLRSVAAPQHLSETGLYADIANKIVAPGNRAYAPQYPLWSDGVSKRRWIRLPSDTTIDTSDPDRWLFPTGTKLWKEFYVDGKRIETRLIEKIGTAAAIGSWRLVSYVWRDDQSDATLVSERGLTGAGTTPFGTSHDIPSAHECRDCHARGGDAVLGFDLLQLSVDRDPWAPHREPEDGMLTMRDLLDEGLLSHPLPHDLRIATPSRAERAAIGYLHGNCGGCHNEQGHAARTGLELRKSSSAATAQDEAVHRTAVGVLTRDFIVPGRRRGLDSFRIEPGSPFTSALALTMESRGRGSYPMPPFGSHVVDDAALQILQEWIYELGDASATRSKL